MGIIQNLTEGGQTWAHRIRMFKQVLKLVSTLTLFVGMCIFIISLFFSPLYLYQGTWYYWKAKSMLILNQNVHVDQDFWAFAGRERVSNPYLSPQRVIVVTEPYVTELNKTLTSNMKFTSSIMSIITCMIFIFFFIRGSSKKGQKHISGSKKQSARWAAFKLKLTKRASDIHIGSVPLIKGTESRHMIITGSTGSGKTNCLHSILKHIRKSGNKAIIIDTTGAFINKYYREGKDHILNPFHEKSEKWNPWIECSNQYDYNSISEAFIPQSYNETDNFWRQAARVLFSSLLSKFEDQQRNTEITRWALCEPLDRLCSLLEGTKASAHIDIKSEKMAGSVRSVASSFLNCFEFLQDTENPFSIKKWIHDENDDSWLFLHSTPSQRAALTPLLTTWISIAVRSILEMTPSFERRIWYVLDELPNLNKIRDLETLVSEGRKYGACGILAMQSPSQLDSIYGSSLSKTITSNCSTKVVFSEYDPEIAQKISRTFGEKEICEYQEGLTYGAHDVRDGVSLSFNKKQVPVISPTEIQNLKRNTAYIRLPDYKHTIKVKLNIVKAK